MNAFGRIVGESMGRCHALVQVPQLLPIHQSLRVTPTMEAGITDHQ
jgi:hypothetical protein